MAENNSEAPASGGSEAQPQPPGMKVLAQYIKDISFENAVVEKGITGNVEPEVEISVALDARKRSVEGQYEVLQKYKITSRAKESGETLFLLELEYGGLFQLSNIPEEQLHPFALIECPRMVFPYVRRIVGDITRDGGFPQLNLDGVDFLKLYRQEIQRRAQAKAANTAPV